MYGSWTLILFWEKGRQFSDSKQRYYIRASIAFVLFGGVMELLQENLIPGRFGAWSDFIANAVGCMIGLAVMSLISRRNQKQTDN